MAPADSRSAVTDNGKAPKFRGWLAFAAAAASMASCYIAVLSEPLTSAIGFGAINPNPHVQGVFMWGLALIAVVALVFDRRVHGAMTPLVVGTAGFLLIFGTLYTHYDIRIETLAYVVLIVAAFLNQNAILSHLNKTVEAQASALSDLNASLEARVEDQVGEIDRLARLKRFLAPEIADLITSEDKEALLDSHRGFIACLFCDIRNFTALSEGIEPEEVMDVLQTYHRTLGRLVSEHSGTIGFRSGDGMMVIINDPVRVEQPAADAIALARAMVRAFDEARGDWEKLGYNIGFGVGVASGYATLGLIGDQGRYDYTAIGSVVNLAARLCDQAGDGEVLVNRRIFADVDGEAEAIPAGKLVLKGFDKPVEAYRLLNADEGANVVKGPFGDSRRSL